MAHQNSILIVENEPAVRMALADYLGKQGYEVIEADSGERAMKLIKSAEIDLAGYRCRDAWMAGWDRPSFMDAGASSTYQAHHRIRRYERVPFPESAGRRGKNIHKALLGRRDQRPRRDLTARTWHQACQW